MGFVFDGHDVIQYIHGQSAVVIMPMVAMMVANKTTSQPNLVIIPLP